MSLVLSGGLLFAPALASRLDQPAPSTLVAGGSATGNLASALEPAADLAEPSPAEPAPDVDDASTAPAGEADPPEPSTTTTHAHPAPKAPKAVKAVKAAAAPKAAPKGAPTAGPPVKRATSAAPAPKADSPAAKPKPEPEPGPKTQAAASEEKSPWAGPASPQSEAEILACIRWVETRGDYGAVSPSGQYRGAYQMDDNFWLYYGGDEELMGHHEQASRAEQDAVATRGLRDRGLAPWPSAVEECA